MRHEPELLTRRQLLRAGLGVCGIVGLSLAGCDLGEDADDPLTTDLRALLPLDAEDELLELGRAVLDVDPDADAVLARLPDPEVTDQGRWIASVRTAVATEAGDGRFLRVDGWLLPVTFAGLAAAYTRAP